MNTVEFSASDIRKILQQLFPHRRLVLSQFTFFNQVGVSQATGETFRRGRRCYRLLDILSIACVLALKEEGIPFKNIESVPKLIQQSAARIFETGEGCFLSGYGDAISLQFPGEVGPSAALNTFLDSNGEQLLFWSFDVGFLSLQLNEISERLLPELQRRAA